MNLQEIHDASNAVSPTVRPAKAVKFSQFPNEWLLNMLIFRLKDELVRDVLREGKTSKERLVGTRRLVCPWLSIIT